MKRAFKAKTIRPTVAWHHSKGKFFTSNFSIELFKRDSKVVCNLRYLGNSFDTNLEFDEYSVTRLMVEVKPKLVSWNCPISSIDINNLLKLLTKELVPDGTGGN